MNYQIILYKKKNNIENNIENNSNKVDLYNDDDKLCIICMEIIGSIKLCSKCNIIYCKICANKVNNKCCICYRNYRKIDDFDELVIFQDNSSIYFIYIKAMCALSLTLGLFCGTLFFLGYIIYIFMK